MDLIGRCVFVLATRRCCGGLSGLIFYSVHLCVWIGRSGCRGKGRGKQRRHSPSRQRLKSGGRAECERRDDGVQAQSSTACKAQPPPRHPRPHPPLDRCLASLSPSHAPPECDSRDCAVRKNNPVQIGSGTAPPLGGDGGDALICAASKGRRVLPLHPPTLAPPHPSRDQSPPPPTPSLCSRSPPPSTANTSSSTSVSAGRGVLGRSAEGESTESVSHRPFLPP